MAQDFRNNLQRNEGTSPVALVVVWNYDAYIGIRICNISVLTVFDSFTILKGGIDPFISKPLIVPTKPAI